MYDLGDTVTLTIAATDATGAPVNAGAVVCTITLPDSSTATPTVGNPATGSYTVSYPTTLAGMHLVRWVGTGANAFAQTDTFNVAAIPDAAFLSLADAKKQLNSTTTVNDDELRLYVEAACDEVEQWVGPIARRQITSEFVDLMGRTVFNELTTAGTRAFVLRNRPVISIDTVVSAILAGVTYTPTDFYVDTNTGIVRRYDGGSIFGPLLVTYTVGRPVVPAWATLAAGIITQHLWKTQRGPARRPGSSDDQQLVPGIGFMIPGMAAELLESHRTVPAIG
jgi:hypothetical protein